MKEWIYGKNPVCEVLKANRRQVYQLMVSQNVQEKGKLTEILQVCKSRNIPINHVPRQVLDAIHQKNQGVAIQVSGYTYQTIFDILLNAEKDGDMPLILILDEIQDPQNMATLLRTAEIVGVHGVILPFRKTVSITPAVVNASSGACEHLAITQQNIAQAIRQLKNEGIWVIGLAASDDAEKIDQFELNRPLAIVIGSEGEGIRSLVLRSCDAILKIPMRGKIESLNAAIAGSVALYFAWQARGFQSSIQ